MPVPDYPASVVVIPHRGLAAAKTRLAPRLAPDDRAALAERLLERVLRVAHDAQDGEVVVISPDADLRAVTEPLGARLLIQRGLGLNAGLEQARRDVASPGMSLLVVLHGDLPWLNVEDVRELIDRVPASGGMAIAPDRAGSGTNGLALRPPDCIPFRFGPGSFEAHVAAARAAGQPVAVVQRAGLAFDLDTPADLDRLLAADAVK